EALRVAEPASVGPLTIRSRVVKLPLENEKFRAALAAGLLELPGSTTRAASAGESPAGPTSLESEVTRIELSEAEIVTVPGELLPKPGLELRQAMRGRFRFMVGLGQDELGYILE